MSLVRTLLAAVAFTAVSPAQLSPTARWAATVPTRYQVFPNITYLVANGQDNKLDIYERRDVQAPQPTLIWIHGGGWRNGTKEQAMGWLLPWMEMGWNVVNVEYRLSTVSPAPAAVEDCLCALRWVVAHANEHKIDPARLVVSGDSAGGHLALTTGMIPDSAGLDRECASASPLPKVAAMVNWYGITDVADLLEGPNMKLYAVQWLGSAPNRVEIAKRVSPLTYVRAGLPPVITIHGDADPTVPYQHGVRLTEALKKAGVSTELVTISGGKHGGFTAEERIRIFSAIQAFLKKNNL